jgi:hypothetical protein
MKEDAQGMSICSVPIERAPKQSVPCKSNLQYNGHCPLLLAINKEEIKVFGPKLRCVVLKHLPVGCLVIQQIS